VPRKAIRRDEPELVGLFGVGLDVTDGHKRVTQGESFVLLGGSAETHERMIDTVVVVTERLHRQGRQLRDVSADELTNMLRDASTKDASKRS
jgi:hypothetical protein